MDISNLIIWIIGLVVTVMVPVWARTAAAISRNGREVSELRGRLDAVEGAHSDLREDIGNAHRRIGGVGRTADRNAGAMEQLRGTLSAIMERLLARTTDGGER